jgi:ribosomal protein L11 methyltransferase
MLDVGTGSGILAISAVKLGYADVEAFDFDPVAVRVAAKNCRVNRVDHKIRLSRRDLARIPMASRKKYDVICANLISNLLIAQRRRMTNRLAPGGSLILAGILNTEFHSVCAVYEKAGFRLVDSEREKEWKSGAFEKATNASFSISKL